MLCEGPRYAVSGIRVCGYEGLDNSWAAKLFESSVEMSM